MKNILAHFLGARSRLWAGEGGHVPPLLPW